MNILVISQYYPPDITAAAFRLKETVELLSSKGHKVSVITARPHKSQSDGQGFVENVEHQLIRTPIFKYTGGGKVNYIVHYTSFMINALIAGLFRARRPDIVLATSPPLFVGISGYLLAKLKGAKFVFDVRDIWPDSAVAAGQINKNGKLFRMAKKVEVWLYRRADLITCVARPMADYIRAHAGHNRLLVIYNGVPASYCRIDLKGEETRLSKMMDPSRLNVVYVGNMGYCQDAGMIVRAAMSLKAEESKTRVQFFLIGDGVERAGLEQIVSEQGLDNVVIDGPVSKQEAFEIMLRSSALFLQLKPDTILEKTIPSKVFDYMVAARPVLFGLEGEGREILEKSQGNLYFEPGALGAFLEALKALEMQYESLAKDAKSNHLIVQQYYTRETMVDRLERSFSELVVSRF